MFPGFFTDREKGNAGWWLHAEDVAFDDGRGENTRLFATRLAWLLMVRLETSISRGRCPASILVGSFYTGLSYIKCKDSNQPLSLQTRLLYRRCRHSLEYLSYRPLPGGHLLAISSDNQWTGGAKPPNLQVSYIIADFHWCIISSYYRIFSKVVKTGRFRCARFLFVRPRYQGRCIYHVVIYCRNMAIEMGDGWRRAM